MNYQNKYFKYKKKYLDLLKGGSNFKTVVWKLDSEEDAMNWNDIIKRIGTESPTEKVRHVWRYGQNYVSSSGIYMASVSLDSRVNPHIAMVINHTFHH